MGRKICPPLQIGCKNSPVVIGLRQVCDPRHIFNYKPAPPTLKSRKSFLHCVDPLEGKITTRKEEAWERKLEELPSSNHSNTKPDESLPSGSQLEWKMWRCLNRLRSDVARTTTKVKKWALLIHPQA